MKKKEPIEAVSDNLTSLLDLYPLDLTDAPKDVDLKMSDGLAQAYANNGFRQFVENAVRVNNRMLIKSSTPEHMLYYKARMDALLQILQLGKTYFVKFEMLRKRTEKERIDSIDL